MEPRHWVPILTFLLIFGLILHIPVLISFSMMFITLVAVATWWRNHSLDGVAYRRRPQYRRGFPGEQTQLRIEVENRKLLPLSWLRVQDPLPKAIAPREESSFAPSHIPDQGYLTNLFTLRWYERSLRYFTLILRKRGIYPVGPALLQSGDLFGLYEIHKESEHCDFFVVFPSLFPFDSIGLPAEDPFGDRRAHRPFYEDPNQPIGVRDYHPGDGFRRVHWLATAHIGKLQAKVYQPIQAKMLMICLNVATYAHHWEGVQPQLFEHLLSLAATLAYKGIQDGYQVGLISNGCLAHADQPFRIPPGRSSKQLATLLQMLAGATPLVTAPFERFLIREVSRLPYGATLMVLTSIITQTICEALWELKQHRRNITLLSLAQEPPPSIPGVRCFHLPFKFASTLEYKPV